MSSVIAIVLLLPVFSAPSTRRRAEGYTSSCRAFGVLNLVEGLDDDCGRRSPVVFKVFRCRLARKDAHEVDARVVRYRLVRVEPVPDDGDFLRREQRKDRREQRGRRLPEDNAARVELHNASKRFGCRYRPGKAT